MHETPKEKFPILYGNAPVHNESHKIFHRWENVGSLDVVTYFPRLIDKRNYTGRNMVTNVYEVAGTERLNDCLSSKSLLFTRNKSSNIVANGAAAARIFEKM